MRVLQITTVLQVGTLVLRRALGRSVGISVPFGPWLALTLLVPLALLVYAWLPVCQRRLGRAFLPLALLVGAAQAVAEKYLITAVLVPPAQQELETLLLLVRSWFAFVVITALVAWQYPLRWALLTALLLSLIDGAVSLPFTGPGTPLFAVLLAVFVARTYSLLVGTLGVGWLMQRQRQQQQALAAANRRLAQLAALAEQLAASQERNRLARELHDTLAHTLSGVSVQLEAVQALWEGDAAAAHTMLEQALASTRAGLTDARRALRALRASPLEELGLARAVSQLAETQAARTGLQLVLAVPPQLDGLAPEVEQCVYRVAQEALTNVGRHAAARTVQVELGCAAGQVRLRIADDGQGFDVAAVDGAHYGVQGLRERAALLGGTLAVESRPGQGTTVRLALRR